MTPRKEKMIVFPALLLIFYCHSTLARIGTFWHVTDFHYDLNYTTTGDPNNMCWNNSPSEAKEGKVGTFGDYSCDAPLSLIHSALNAMKTIQPNPDFILWTGDDTSHVSDQHFSVDRVASIVEILTGAIIDKFPDTPVIPVLGNHDFYPKNQAPVGPNALQTKVGHLWTPWLSDLHPDALSTFYTSGRYWCDVTGSNVSVVALNTLLWYKSNNFTLHLPNGLDPDEQFTWLDQLLNDLTNRNRRVYLVGHIPPGSFERYQQEREGFHWYQDRYNHRFMQLVEKHNQVIEAQFFAHHHTDSFRLFFKSPSGGDPGTPVSYQLIGPGVTPWRSTLSPETGANNPGVRLIYYDTQTGQVVDVSTYYLPLNQANTEGEARWRLEYNFSSSYQLTSLTPKSLYDLAKRMKNDQSVFNKYYQFNTVSLEDPSVCTDTPGCERLHWCAITELNYTRFYNCNSAFSNSPTVLSVLIIVVGLLSSFLN